VGQRGKAKHESQNCLYGTAEALVRPLRKKTSGGGGLKKLRPVGGKPVTNPFANDEMKGKKEIPPGSGFIRVRRTKGGCHQKSIKGASAVANSPRKKDLEARTWFGKKP